MAAHHAPAADLGARGNTRKTARMTAERCCRNLWQGRKDSNPRMPESKSGALTNLATPLHLTLRFAEQVGPFSKAKTYAAKAKSGWVSRLVVTALLQDSGRMACAASASIRLENAAKTLAPDPVIRAGTTHSTFSSNHRITCATSAYFSATTACMSFRPKLSGHPICFACCARKTAIVQGFVSLVNDFSEKIAAVGT